MDDRPTIDEVMRKGTANVYVGCSRDQVFAAALLWLIERTEGFGHCWDLRQQLERIALGGAHADDAVARTSREGTD